MGLEDVISLPLSQRLFFEKVLFGLSSPIFSSRGFHQSVIEIVVAGQQRQFAPTSHSPESPQARRGTHGARPSARVPAADHAAQGQQALF